jgi:hypothetical protein
MAGKWERTRIPGVYKQEGADGKLRYMAAFRDARGVVTSLTKPTTYVQSQIGTTTSLAGEQTATFDGLEASWSYHPDSGLDMTIHEQEG